MNNLKVIQKTHSVKSCRISDERVERCTISITIHNVSTHISESISSALPSKYLIHLLQKSVVNDSRAIDPSVVYSNQKISLKLDS